MSTKYFVRIYCHVSHEVGTCACDPQHPFVLSEPYDSIRSANERGYALIGVGRDDDLEWEVINDRGKVVC